MKYEIKSRWNGSIICTSEIECDTNASEGVKLGLALQVVISSGAALRGANLSGANLSGAPSCLRVPNIHSAVYAAASVDGALKMDEWHKNGDACGTTHCRAGWVVTLAGPAGQALEWAMGTPAAAAVIYMASDQKLEKIPDFYCDNATALADMKRLAELEQASSVAGET